MDLKRYEELKKKAIQLQREADRAEGALQQLNERLEKEYGCKTLEQAEQRLKQLKRDADKAEAKFNKALDDFEAEWEEVLDA